MVRAPLVAGAARARSTRASNNAPMATLTLRRTPIQVVAIVPTAGINQSPAVRAPAAAPAVLAAYNAPASPAPSDSARIRRAWRRDGATTFANQDAAIGNVAPMAAVGMPSATIDRAARTIPKRPGASPSCES